MANAKYYYIGKPNLYLLLQNQTTVRERPKSNWCLEKMEREEQRIGTTATALQAAHLSSTQWATEKTAKIVRSSHAVDFAIFRDFRVEYKSVGFGDDFLTTRPWSESDIT